MMDSSMVRVMFHTEDCKYNFLFICCSDAVTCGTTFSLAGCM